jgi:UPF0246 protein FP0718
MKIVISPAKTINETSALPTTVHSSAIFPKEISEVSTALKALSPKQLINLMHISQKLADLNWQRHQQLSLPFTSQNARPALFAYNGDVYEGLDAYSLSETQMDKLQRSLRILSGLYGLLKPLDLIAPYRLEMSIKLPVGKATNLYAFWKDKITQALNDELQEGELFINLASEEYFKAIDTTKLKVPVITPIFKDYKGDTLKVVSFYAKKARGRMVRFLAENEIRSVEDLKGFNTDGYAFSEKFSKGNELVFIR